MNIFNIQRTFEMKVERGWDTIYFAIDLHCTLVKPGSKTIEFYPGAVEVIKWFNQRKDIKLILWTSIYPDEVERFCKECSKLGIAFDFLNNNPLEKNNERSFFGQKFYFNILLDDKSGFVGETDWNLVKSELIRIGEWVV